jgi:hypothetical protein
MKEVRYGSPHESPQSGDLLGAKFDRDSLLPTMLQIKEKTRQASGLFLWAILFYNAWHNCPAGELAKLVEDHAHALQDTSLVRGQRFWSDDNVFFGKCVTNGIQRYAQPSGIHYPGSGGESAHPAYCCHCLTRILSHTLGLHVSPVPGFRTLGQANRRGGSVSGRVRAQGGDGAQGPRYRWWGSSELSGSASLNAAMRTRTAPHVHAIQTRSLSTPPAH